MARLGKLMWFASTTTLVSLAALHGCVERPLPGTGFVTLYNAENRRTLEFSPLETVYVGLDGLAPDKRYEVDAVDVEDNVISSLTATTDASGTMRPAALWFDIGIRRATDGTGDAFVPTDDELVVRSFFVRLRSEDGLTNFRQPFSIVYRTRSIDERPQTVAYAANANGSVSNAFHEAGSNAYDEALRRVERSPRTKVYLGIDRLDAAVSELDVYVVPFVGQPFANGDSLAARLGGAIRKRLTRNDLTRIDGQSGFVSREPIWDIDTTNAPGSTARLTNPTEATTAYSIVVVTDPSRPTLKLSDVVNGRNVSITDAVDGNAVPGFIVLDTPANDLRFEVTDNLGNHNATLVEATSAGQRNALDAGRYLKLGVESVAQDPGTTARIFVVDSAGVAPANGAAVPADVRGRPTATFVSAPARGDQRMLPYIAPTAFFATSNTDAALADLRYAADVAADRSFDVVVKFGSAATFDAGKDLFLPRAVSVRDFTVDTNLGTFSAARAEAETIYFDETNTKPATRTKVYVRYATNLTRGSTDTKRVYLYRGGAAALPVGAPLGTAALLQKELAFASQPNKTALFWDLDAEAKVVNPSTDPTSPRFGGYDVIVDVNGNGVLDAGERLQIVVNDTVANTFPKVTYANIASRGYQIACRDAPPPWGYADLFAVNGSNTTCRAGIYAIWNPLRDSGVVSYGTWVTVYIVDATKVDLGSFSTIALTNAIDVTGAAHRVPVQRSCDNGAGHAVLWPTSQLKRGSFYVIVDRNNDGRITEGVDIIDAVDASGRTVVDTPGTVGFRVE
jgi:hypothetical protein